MIAGFHFAPITFIIFSTSSTRSLARCSKVTSFWYQKCAYLHFYTSQSTTGQQPERSSEMTLPVTKYSDQWGECIVRPNDGCSEIRWFDTTETMSGDDFDNFLGEFASVVEGAGQPGALVDAVQFKMDMRRMSMGWRDENIIPRYNAAGLRRFAFIMPAGMLAIGAPPATEGPAAFPTAYFGSRQAAVAWLNKN